MTKGAAKGESAGDAPVRVAVIGGGIAGLTAAWELGKRGFVVEVFEADVNLGGKLGANPGRLPLKPLLGDERNLSEADLQHVPGSLRKDRTLDEAQQEDIRACLIQGGIPEWIRLAINRRIETRAKVLGIETKDLYLQPDDKFSVEPKIVVMDENGELSYSDGSPFDPASFAGVDGEEAFAADTPRNTPNDEAIVTWLVTRRTEDDERDMGAISFRVTLHPRLNETVVADVNDGLSHEHCYHMYLNWYRNFWRLMEEIKLEKSTDFEPRDQYVHLFPGRDDIRRRVRTLDKLGSFDHWADNMLSGVSTIPDAFLGLYSVLDLASRPLDAERYLDRQSVHSFLSSRWYATEESLKLHEVLLVRAFAVPTYFSSAYAYQKYLSYTLASPEPTLWVLKGNTEETLFKPFGDALGHRGCKINLGHRVTRFGLDGKGRIRDIVFRPSDMRWPRSRYDGERIDERAGPEQEAVFTPDYVVVAVPPRSLADMVSDFRHLVPGLSGVRRLQSGVTAVLDLYFNKRLDDIPGEHVILRDSRYGLTFFDNSQLWPEMPDPTDSKKMIVDPGAHTKLSVAVTDFYRIEGMEKDEAMREIIEDLQRFIPFDFSDIDLMRTYMQLNVNEPLFLNEVGSEPWRPEARTSVRNLFLAGDFCANPIDVACVEGAVVSGLLAARALQEQVRVDHPDLAANSPLLERIDVLQPKALAPGNAEVMKALVAHQLPAAKAASRVHELRRHPERAASMRDAQAAVDAAFHMPATMASDAAGLATAVGEWLVDLPNRRP